MFNHVTLLYKVQYHAKTSAIMLGRRVRGTTRVPRTGPHRAEFFFNSNFTPTSKAGRLSKQAGSQRVPRPGALRAEACLKAAGSRFSVSSILHSAMPKGREPAPSWRIRCRVEYTVLHMSHCWIPYFLLGGNCVLLVLSFMDTAVQ